MHIVAEQGKRRAPAAPPGLEPNEPIKDVYDTDRAIGTLINPVNSGRADSRNLVNYGDVVQRPFTALPLYGCIDATHLGFRGLCPRVEYKSVQGLQKMLLSKNLVKCW